MPWGGTAHLQTSWQVPNLAQDAGVSKQPCPAIYLLLTPAYHFCKSSISQHSGPQPWTHMQWPAFHGARSIPQAWKILSQLMDAATMAAPLQSAPWYPEVLPRAGCCMWAVMFVGGLKNPPTVIFLPHLLKHNSFKDRWISMLKE